MNVINQKPYKVKNFPKFLFFYDKQNGIVIRVAELTEDDKKENKEWNEKYGENLFDLIKIGEKEYMELQAAGLMYENWKNKEARDEYLAEWAAEIEAEQEMLVKEFEGSDWI